MTTVIIRNRPLPEYEQEHGIGQGQRAMVRDYAKLLKELEILEQQTPVVDSDIKTIRKQQKTDKKQHDQVMEDLLYRIRVLEKHIDHCALVTHTLDDIEVMDENWVWKDIRQTTGPYVVRAMATKKYIEYAQQTGQDFVFLENGYFGNYQNSVNPKSKKQWQRICMNELQQQAILRVPDDRWQNLIQVDPKLRWTGWKKSGSKILIVAPSKKPCQYYNQDVGQWLADTVAEIQRHTDREIVIRQKASRTDRTQKQTIYDAFDDDVFCMVTYQSIAAVEAVAYGIPVFTLAPSAAKLVGSQDLSQIEAPYYPDPELVYQWCSSLAYGQFSLDEMLTGKAWRMVMENQHRDKISC